MNECWCVSAGGNTCSYPDPESGICEPDECSIREDCPGSGYWCDENSGNLLRAGHGLNQSLKIQGHYKA